MTAILKSRHDLEGEITDLKLVVKQLQKRVAELDRFNTGLAEESHRLQEAARAVVEAHESGARIQAQLLIDKLAALLKEIGP